MIITPLDPGWILVLVTLFRLDDRCAIVLILKSKTKTEHAP